jgi:hypothetical protein
VPLAEGQVYKVVGRSGRSPRFRSVDQVAGNEKETTSAREMPRI